MENLTKIQKSAVVSAPTWFICIYMFPFTLSSSLRDCIATKVENLLIFSNIKLLPYSPFHRLNPEIILHHHPSYNANTQPGLQLQDSI